MKSRLFAAALISACAGVAQAQLSYTFEQGFDVFSFGCSPSGSGTFGATASTNGFTPGVFNFSYTSGIISSPVDRNAVTFGTNTMFYASFRVGFVPVRVSNLTQVVGQKVVNGGGSGATPIVNHSVVTQIFEVVDANQNGRFDIGESTYGPAASVAWDRTLAGNGVLMINDTVNGTGSYVLAGERVYVVTMDIGFTGTQTAPLPSTIPSVTVTQEFPGSGLPGFEFSMDYQTVPEPGTMAALGVGALAVLRRRKKQ